jgi:tetrahydromethanopterin S-methyltransferase subunit E
MAKLVKNPHPLQYTKLPSGLRRPLSFRNGVFVTGICLLYGPPLIAVLFFGFITLSNLISGASTFGFSAVGSDWVNLVVLAGLLVLLVLIFRWTRRKVRDRELDN